VENRVQHVPQVQHSRERERTAQKRIMSAPNVSRERENSTENRGAG